MLQEFYTYWSIVCNWRWFLLSGNLAFRQTFASTSGRHFLLNFPFQRSSLRMTLSSVSDSYAKSCIFATFFPSLLTFFLLVLKNQTKCSKAYDSHRGVCTERIYDFSFRELLVYWNLGCLQGPPCFFLFAVLLGLAKANHKRWIQICCETSWSFSSNTSSKTKICCRK